MIDLATAKAHLRVSAAAEDALITLYLSSAKAAIESATAKLLTAQTVIQKAEGFPCGDRAIRLFKGPVSAIVSVKYDDVNGVEQTLTDFRLIEGVNAKLLPAYASSWPVAKAAEGSVRITYTAGYATNGVPPEIDQAVLYLVAHFYSNREAVAVSSGGGTAVELPLAIEMLMAPHRSAGIA